MFDWRSADEWRRLWRYYQAGILNTLFGYGLYALLVALHLNMYVAQAIAHLAGMTFNYFSYSRYAFAGHRVSTGRFVLSYGVNYLLLVASLAAASRIVKSPYLAGLGATVFVSAINYLVLSRFVFSRDVAR
jgi:putative flippase GtrA